jgi:hypothetical protein
MVLPGAYACETTQHHAGDNPRVTSENQFEPIFHYASPGKLTYGIRLMLDTATSVHDLI